MNTTVQLTQAPILRPSYFCRGNGESGALVEFWGVVRDEEKGSPIQALHYEAYATMAVRQMQLILQQLSKKHPCLEAQVIHRLGIIPVGEAAIWVGIAATHRQEAFAMLTEFMDRLKQEVPIWKVRGVRVGC